MEPKKRVAIIGVGETSMFDKAPRLVITMPGGFKASIRETTGEDDDIVSRLGDNKEGTALYKFLQNVILVDDKPVPFEELLKWKVRDIYYGIMKTRMFTHGSQVVFEHTFSGDITKTFTEDLGFYDWDLSDTQNYPPQLGEEGFDARVIQPYRLAGEWVEGLTKSQKKYRFRYLTAKDEIKTLGIKADDLTINDKLRIREFQIYLDNGSWTTVERFNILTSRDMAEIRTVLDKTDPEFTMITRLTDPTTQAIVELPLLGVTGFFFPRA